MWPVRAVALEARRFGPAIVDQAVWSLAGLAASALVARFLGAEGLGLFAVGTAILYGVGGLFNSLVLDPAAVIGPRDFGDRLKEYGGRVVLVAVVLGVPFVVAGTAFLLFGETRSFVGAVLIAVLPVQLAWSCRRLPYLTDQPSLAMASTTAYLVVVVGLIVAAHLSNLLDVAVAVMLLGAASLAQSGLVIVSWRPVLRSDAESLGLRRLGIAHWSFGRWLLAAEASSWVVNYGLAAMAAAIVDLSSAGAFRASQILLRPYGIVFIGIGLAYLPRLTVAVRTSGVDGVDDMVRRIGWGLSGVGMVVFMITLFGGDLIMRLVFGPQFVGYGWLVATLTGAMILHGWIAAYSMGLQAMSRPRDSFLGQAAGAVAALVASLLLGVALGLVGFAIAFLIATMARHAVVLIRYKRSLASP